MNKPESAESGSRSAGLICAAGVLVALFLALLGLIVASSLEMNIWAGLVGICSTLWGVTTLVDVYTGLIFVAVWIAVLERERPARATAWFVALMLLGNLATAAYFLLRARRARSLADVFVPGFMPEAPSQTPDRPKVRADTPA